MSKARDVCGASSMRGASFYSQGTVIVESFRLRWDLRAAFQFYAP